MSTSSRSSTGPEQNDPKSIDCPNCTNKLQATDNFCSRCGTPIGGNRSKSEAGPDTTSFIPKRKEGKRARKGGWLVFGVSLGAATVSAVVLGTGAIQRAHGKGVKPEKGANTAILQSKSDIQVSGHVTGEIPTLSEATVKRNPLLKDLVSRAQASPKDPAGWSAVGVALTELMDESPSSGEIQLEAIDVFSYLLSISPDDIFALRVLGDLSFEQRLFQKALSYYERYLRINPTDIELRSRKASTLTFLGRTKDAISELQDITKANAANTASVGIQPIAIFQPLAYLSIALSQDGQFNEARKIGQEALLKAPSEEARERFSKFLNSLPDKDIDPTTNTDSSDWLSAIKSRIKSNQIAGSKFIDLQFNSDKSSLNKGELSLYFSQFPMEGMPEFAKIKFLSSIKEIIPPNSVGILKFIDQPTGRIMITETLN
jgi:tetratricopeptide (TPR) repeat protein